MKVIYVKSSRSKGYTSVGLFGEDSKKLSLTVKDEEYISLGSPSVGDTVSDEVIEALSASDERYRATLSALRMLGYGDNSQKNLYRKLTMKGISRDVAEKTVGEMVSRGYINEDGQIRKLVLREANQSLSGPRKIRARLMQKGYSASSINEAIDSLISDGEIDFKASGERLVEKKLTRDATDDEIKQLLYKNGYDIC